VLNMCHVSPVRALSCHHASLTPRRVLPVALAVIAAVAAIYVFTATGNIHNAKVYAPGSTFGVLSLVATMVAIHEFCKKTQSIVSESEPPTESPHTPRRTSLVPGSPDEPRTPVPAAPTEIVATQDGDTPMLGALFATPAGGPQVPVLLEPVEDSEVRARREFAGRLDHAADASIDERINFLKQILPTPQAGLFLEEGLTKIAIMQRLLTVDEEKIRFLKEVALETIAWPPNENLGVAIMTILPDAAQRQSLLVEIMKALAPNNPLDIRSLASALLAQPQERRQLLASVINNRECKITKAVREMIMDWIAELLIITTDYPFLPNAEDQDETAMQRDKNYLATASCDLFMLTLREDTAATTTPRSPSPEIRGEILQRVDPLLPYFTPDQLSKIFYASANTPSFVESILKHLVNRDRIEEDIILKCIPVIITHIPSAVRARYSLDGLIAQLIEKIGEQTFITCLLAWNETYQLSIVNAPQTPVYQAITSWLQSLFLTADHHVAEGAVDKAYGYLRELSSQTRVPLYVLKVCFDLTPPANVKLATKFLEKGRVYGTNWRKDSHLDIRHYIESQGSLYDAAQQCVIKPPKENFPTVSSPSANTPSTRPMNTAHRVSPPSSPSILRTFSGD